MKITRTVLGTAAGLLTLGGAVAAPAAADHHDDPATYEVTVENLTHGQYLTPLVWAGHDRHQQIFDWRGHATPGLQALAENGDVPAYAAEVGAHFDDHGVGGEAPIGPRSEVTFTVETDESHLSVAGMVICTNDGFGAVDGRRLPGHLGQTRAWRLLGYDAGTEVNTEARNDLVPAPFCGEGGGTGETNPDLAENGIVRFHRGIRGVGDLDSSFDWDGVVGRVTVTRVG